MIAANLPALQIVVPLISAPLCALIPNGRVAWLVTTAIAWLTLIMAVALLSQVSAGIPVSYEMGGWAAPWGIEYHIDRLSALMLVLVAGIGAVVTPALYSGIAREVAADRQPLFFTAFLLALTGFLGIVITGDAFNLYVFLEISSLASYTLVAMGSDRRALKAAFQYLILGTIGATFILIGIGLLYMLTGTLNMADLADRLPELSRLRPVRAAFAFIVIGAGIKLALFPLHIWLPNAYTYAPSVVAAFLAATATKVGVYVLARFVFTVFGAEFAFDVMPLGEILRPLALISIIAGSLVAIFQSNLKRMLAYSSVAQIGYMALGLSFASVNGLVAALVHLFNHAAMKGALFLVLACVVHRMGTVDLASIRGLGRRMPLTMGAFVAGGMSLVGVPLTVGFISKWYLILAALEQGGWLVVATVVVGSLLALVYVLRVVEAAYFLDPADGAPQVDEAPLVMLLPTLTLAAACIYFGIHTSVTVDVARIAALNLLGGFR
ncbi:MAG: monovalent cation/H+ antiporter subunit D family protein [Pseudomonadota bacterium]|nr:monovalent cation/H+ antiporter subunit D family protein [Pseudomonadota bacterium]